MRINRREANLLVLTLIVILGVSGYLLGERAMVERRSISRRVTETRETIKRRRAIIDESRTWERELRELRESLPAYPPEQDVTTDLLNLLEQTATRHNLTLLRRDVERERRDGELFELTINCRWRGDLDSLVHFLFDMHQQGVRLGVRQMSITPRGRGQLDGTMTIDGTYSRRIPTAEPSEASASPS